MPAPVFVTAEWRWLAMLSYAVDPALLRPLVPAGTELDDWQGETLVSVVGFRFLKTRVGGWAIPWHQDFDEVNLRFYVRRRAVDGWRRGVVFIREIVPRRAIAWVARYVYNENYVRRPMRSELRLPASDGDAGQVSYEWRAAGEWLGLRAAIAGTPEPLADGSEAEFVTEHYWGYARQGDGGTLEYRVEHPRWQVWPAAQAEFRGDATTTYGGVVARALRQPPASAFVADGSPIVVRRGSRMT